MTKPVEVPTPLGSISAKRKAFAEEFRALLDQVARKLEHAERLYLTISFRVDPTPDDPKKYAASATIQVKPEQL